MEQRKHIHQALRNMSHAGVCGQEFAVEYLKVISLDNVKSWLFLLVEVFILGLALHCRLHRLECSGDEKLMC